MVRSYIAFACLAISASGSAQWDGLRATGTPPPGVVAQVDARVRSHIGALHLSPETHVRGSCDFGATSAVCRIAVERAGAEQVTEVDLPLEADFIDNVAFVVGDACVSEPAAAPESVVALAPVPVAEEPVRVVSERLSAPRKQWRVLLGAGPDLDVGFGGAPILYGAGTTLRLALGFFDVALGASIAFGHDASGFHTLDFRRVRVGPRVGVKLPLTTSVSVGLEAGGVLEGLRSSTETTGDTTRLWSPAGIGALRLEWALSRHLCAELAGEVAVIAKRQRILEGDTLLVAFERVRFTTAVRLAYVL